MRLKFIILVLIQIILLTGIIGYREYWISAGERILLKTVPVDPRDIFRGDYVQLTYEISNIDLDSIGIKDSFRRNEKAYVVLEQDTENTYKAISVNKTMPDGKRFIQGRVRYETQVSHWDVTLKEDNGNLRNIAPRWFFGFKKGDRIIFCIDQTDNVIQFYKDAMPDYGCPAGSTITGIVEDVKETKSRQLNVEYGIESYFVEEGKGRAIESARNARKVTVEVSIRKDGKGIISALLIDGKVIR